LADISSTLFTLTRKAISYLAAAGMDRACRIVVNRADGQGDPDAKGLEEAVEAPVYSILPNDYFALNTAAAEGKPLEKECALRVAFDDLAERISRMRPEQESPLRQPREIGIGEEAAAFPA